MPWQFFIALSVSLYSISVLLQRTILKESDSKPVAYSIVFQTIIAFLIFFVATLFGKWQLPNFQPLLLNLFIMSVLYAIANVCIFTALKSVQASKFTILFATRGIFTVIASSLVLSEGLSPIQLLGAVLIFAGVIVVNIQSNQLKFVKGDLLALAAGMLFGFANTNDRVLLLQMNVYVFSSISFLLPAILMALVYPKELKHITVFLKPKLIKRMLILCVFYAASAITFFLALQLTNNSSQVASINLTSVILIVLLAVVFLKERTDLSKKLLGAVLAFLGLLLI